MAESQTRPRRVPNTGIGAAFTAVTVLLCCSSSMAATQALVADDLLLNEVEVDNPGADIAACEFVEILGADGAVVAADVFLLEIEGDGTSAGTLDFVRNLGGELLGENGVLVVAGPGAATQNQSGSCGSRRYQDTGATLLEDAGVSLENGTVTFLLISAPGQSIVSGVDWDLNNDGFLEGMPGNATVLDAVGWKDVGSSDWVYEGVNITPSNTSGAPDAATRNPLVTEPLLTSAWFADDLVGLNSDSVLFDPTNRGGFRTERITPGVRNDLSDSLIFSDGFETGSTKAWSLAVP